MLRAGRDVVCTKRTAWLRERKATPERVTGGKTRGLHTEEVGCEPQTFSISLRTRSVIFFFPAAGLMMNICLIFHSIPFEWEIEKNVKSGQQRKVTEYLL